MAANVFLRSIAVTGLGYVPFATVSTVVTATIATNPSNRGNMNVRYQGASPVPWPPGVSARLEGVDLSDFEVGGDTGDMILIVGHSR